MNQHDKKIQWKENQVKKYLNGKPTLILQDWGELDRLNNWETRSPKLWKFVCLFDELPSAQFPHSFTKKLYKPKSGYRFFTLAY